MAFTPKTKGRQLRRIRFNCPRHGKRCCIRPGKLTLTQVETMSSRIERLCAHRSAGTAPESDLTEWMSGDVSASLAQALERHGLTTGRQQNPHMSLGEFLQSYLDRRKDLKAATTYQLEAVRDHLVTCFGSDTPLDEFKASDGERFRLHLRNDCGLNENTTRRRLGRARQFFRAAVAEEFVKSNPFAGLKVSVQADPERFHFVTREDAQRLIDAAPNAQWRLIIALCRYGGVRCPSEVLSLKWEHIDWEHGRVTVPSPKTAHHAGLGSRVIPLFPELRPYLEDAQELSDGSAYCITRYRDCNSNLRTGITRIAARAGVQMWPKPFQNMRSTRETELAGEYPQHVACRWIGNSQSVAAKHYLQLTDEHFAKATSRGTEAPQNAPHHTNIPSTTELPATPTDAPKTPEFPGPSDSAALDVTGQVAQQGFEP